MFYQEQEEPTGHLINRIEERSRLSIIIPTYNEAENITELVERISYSLSNMRFEMIIVDDGSPDGTANIAEALNRKYGNIKVLKRPCKLGLASAVKDGLTKAESEIIAVIDADLQHPPELLPKMYEKIREGHDLVIASRYVEGGMLGKWSLWRKLISKGATILVHLFFSKTRRVKDPLSGYFMFKKKVIEGVRLDLTGFKILLEVLVKGKYDSAAEVPYTFMFRKKGKSKLSLKEMISYILLLLKMKLRA